MSVTAFISRGATSWRVAPAHSSWSALWLRAWASRYPIPQIATDIAQNSWIIARAVLAACLTACLATGQPRPAEVAAVGQLSWDVYLPLGTLGFGSADARAPEEDTYRPLTIRGPTSGLDEIVGTGPPPFWWEVSGRTGIFPGCELGALAGFFRLGGEARCALLDQRQGAPFSAALGLTAAYLPFYDRGGPWWRASLDLSHRRGKTLALLLNLHASRGPEGRQLEGNIPTEFWDIPPDDTVSHQSRAVAYIVRDEWRVAAAMGAAFSLSGRYGFVIGAVPYIILAPDPAVHFTCRNCSRVQLLEFHERFGFSLTVGVTRLL